MAHSHRLTRRRFLATAAAASFLAACGSSDDDGDTRPTHTPASPPGPTEAPSATPTAPAPSATPASPSLEEMAGQMLMLGFPGTVLTPDNPIVADIRERHVGAVILFSQNVATGGPRNIQSPGQLRELCQALQDTAGGSLLIATDQEGGVVARLGPDHGFPATRSAAELGATGDPEVTRAAAAEMADTLASVGVNFNIAPVVDVNTNPANPIIGALDRSFSSDPAAVAAHAAAFIEAHHERGILTSLKHFPGHGSSTGDSHEGFVDVTPTWDPLELEPYRELVSAGLADTVMVAHVSNSNWDPEHPASLSPAVIQGMLRNDIGFDGAVLSDDMGMGAITGRYSIEESIRLAIEAGNDILVFGGNLAGTPEGIGARVHAAIVDLVRRGDIAEERIAESYRRISALKARVA